MMTSKTIASVVPNRTIGKPEDAAKLVTFLAGDDSGWITGQTIKSEGGFWENRMKDGEQTWEKCLGRNTAGVLTV